MITIERQPVTITQFPDGTSKFTCESFDFIKNIKQAQTSSKIEIEWYNALLTGFAATVMTICCSLCLMCQMQEWTAYKTTKCSR